MSRFVTAAVEPSPLAHVVRVADDIGSRQDLFDALDVGLQFPYFGQNWDALLDLLSDLSWLSIDEVWIVHDHVPLALGDAWETYLAVLADAVTRRNEAVSRGFPDRPQLIVSLPGAKIPPETQTS